MICCAMFDMGCCMFLISWTQGQFALSLGEEELDAIECWQAFSSKVTFAFSFGDCALSGIGDHDEFGGVDDEPGKAQTIPDVDLDGTSTEEGVASTRASEEPLISHGGIHLPQLL